MAQEKYYERIQELVMYKFLAHFVTDIYSFIKEDDKDKLAKEYSPWIDHTGDMADCFHGEKIRCYAYIQDGGFCVRANTLGTYCEANRQVSQVVLTCKEVITLTQYVEEAYFTRHKLCIML